MCERCIADRDRFEDALAMLETIGDLASRPGSLNELEAGNLAITLRVIREMASEAVFGKAA